MLSDFENGDFLQASCLSKYAFLLCCSCWQTGFSSFQLIQKTIANILVHSGTCSILLVEAAQL